MKQAAAAVIEFNVEVLGISPRPISPMPDNEYKHLRKCLLEELEELNDAQTQQDVVKATDALLDAMYFALGGLHKMGLTSDQINTCFMLIHESNMRKKKGTIASRAVDGAADAIKPLGWASAEEQMAEVLGLAG